MGGRQAGSAPLNRRARNVDEYIDLAAEELQGKPRGIRATIREAAPDAKEGINYMIPAYTLNGPLVLFGLQPKHIRLYLLPPLIAQHSKDLGGYETNVSNSHSPGQKGPRAAHQEARQGGHEE
ncbi:MAG TPA: hypothetical protein VEC02_00510 [Nitrososphaerales archaeon]|nr:hypothetical protein [Nitrososphaerales archaeon]